MQAKHWIVLAVGGIVLCTALAIVNTSSAQPDPPDGCCRLPHGCVDTDMGPIDDVLLTQDVCELSLGTWFHGFRCNAESECVSPQ